MELTLLLFQLVESIQLLILLRHLLCYSVTVVQKRLSLVGTGPALRGHPLLQRR